MKKIILSALTIFILSVDGFSQKPWIGFQAGCGFSDMVLKGNLEMSTSQLLPGFNTGVLMDWSVTKHISIQPAINLITKGGFRKFNFSEEEMKTTLDYLEIPANIIFYSKPDKLGFFAGAGFNLGFGLTGHKNINTPLIESLFLYEFGEVKFGNGEDDDMRTFEVGANLLIGYSCKPGLFFSVTGNIGLNNLSNENGSTIKNNYFALKVGWLIRRKS